MIVAPIGTGRDESRPRTIVARLAGPSPRVTPADLPEDGRGETMGDVVEIEDCVAWRKTNRVAGIESDRNPVPGWNTS